MAASSCIVIGLNVSSGVGCKSTSSSQLRSRSDIPSGASPPTLCLIILGLMIFIIGGMYDVRTKRDALFPPAVFTDLTIGKYFNAF